MVTVKVLCDCGEFFTGHAHDEFDACTIANRKRTRCREADPDGHAAMRNARKMSVNLAGDFAGSR